MNGAAPMDRWRALSSRLHNALFVLFLGGILAYGAGFAWYMLARLDLINLANIWILREGTDVHVLPAVPDYTARQHRERSSVGTILFEGPPYLHQAKNAPHKRQFRLLTPEPPDMSSGGTNRSDWFWQRMAPHFDHRSDSVGLIVDGRLAQAFVRNCTSGELAVWSWAGPEDGTAASVWTRTQTGLCVDMRLLPRKALPPVRVETMSASDLGVGAAGRWAADHPLRLGCVSR